MATEQTTGTESQIFTLHMVRGAKDKEYTDAKKAGAAYFNADPAKQPSVTHMENNRGRIMSQTEVHGSYEDGKPRYYKPLPDVLPVDKEFQDGFYEALEKSVKKRLQALSKHANEPDNKAEQPPKLDNRLTDDLNRLAAVDKSKAAKIWEKSAPDGLPRPEILDEQNTKPTSSARPVQENSIAFFDKTLQRNTDQLVPPTSEVDNDQSTEKTTANVDVPDYIASRYLRAKNQYYFPDKTLAFEDNGKKLKLETENIAVIRDALAIAENRNWQTITISGTDNFKQQVWREASLKGIEVVGYKPTELEIAELQKALTAKTVKTRAPESSSKPRGDAIIGKLLAHGADHYKHDPEQGKSYFVKLEVDGKEITRWGADLKRAMAESQSQPQIGDTIVLDNTGKQNITIPTSSRDDDGNVVESKMAVKKNTWRIETVNYQNSLDEQAEAIRTGKEIEHKVIIEMPQVAEAIAAAKLGEKIAEQARQSGVIKSEDEKNTLVHLIRAGLASALEKGKKITVPEIKDQAQQATIDANNILNDQKPHVKTHQPPEMSMSR